MILKRTLRLSKLNISICYPVPFRPRPGFLSVAAICCLFIAGCVSTEYNVGTHRQDIIFYSTEKEIAMGQVISKEVAKEMRISNNPHDIERINKIGKKIVEVCDRKEISYYFYVITGDEKGDTEDKNAFSVPGGYIYVYKALLDDLNDDELAFVLAHEIGHVVSRHVIKKLQAAMGYNLLILASGAASHDGQFTQGVSFALAQIMAAYSREDEFNADEIAVKYTHALGFDPKAGINVMEKLYKENKKRIYPISYFRTHPYTAQRIAHIKETLHLPLDVADYIN
ncbi:MAG: M48 family metalloprotease [Candidatus Omnitrophica bacterium]|jgi:predicted Zn-dependent protease|nr:M48 family metalloprotease [Candidatus Omnitrophota bacterium]